MWSVGKRITFRRGFARELVEIVYFEGEMGEIGPNYDRSALIEFAKLVIKFKLRV